MGKNTMTAVLKYISKDFNKLNLLLISVILLFCLSCTDELEHIMHSDNQISFTITDKSDWIDSRSSDSKNGLNSKYTNIAVIEAESKGDEKMYLHSFTSPIDNKAYEKTNSRAALSSNSVVTDGISLSAFCYDSQSNDYSIPNYFVNEHVYKSGEKWLCERYWPSKDCKMKFYGFAPFGDKNIIEFKFPYIGYKIDNDFEKQNNFFVTQTDEIEVKNAFSSPVFLELHNALTAVRFEVDNNAFETGTIKSISLVNVYGEGIYSFNDNKWYTPDNANEELTSIYIQDRNYKTFKYESDFQTGDISSTKIMNDDIGFLMIPQTFTETSDAYVDVEFLDKLTNETLYLRFSLAGKDGKVNYWPMGKKVTYRLSTNPNLIIREFYLEDEIGNIYESGNINDFFTSEYNGVKKSFTIYSRALIANGTEDPIVKPLIPIVPNLKDVKDDKGRQFCSIEHDPSSLKNNPSEGIYSFILNIEPQISAQGNDLPLHDNILRNCRMNIQDSVGISVAYNLSNTLEPSSRLYEYDDINPNEGYCTANCYLIGAPGKYCFPLIYGNAISKGKNNKRSYMAANTNVQSNVSKTDYKRLLNLIDYEGNDISSPYLPTPDDVMVLWMDGEGLISNHIEIDNHFVYFEVPKTFIKQGNAVIAVRKGDDIIWSWHIWITDFNPTTANDYDPGNGFYFMRHNIGWCYGRSLNYVERETDFEIIISNIDEHVNVKLRQHKKELIDNGNNTLYQYSRKDPFPAGYWDDEHECYKDKLASGYNINYISTGGESVGENSIAKSIRTPSTFYYCGNYNWQSANGLALINLWNIGQDAIGNRTNTNVKNARKTIYDPSPVGYRIPPPGAFNIFNNENLIYDKISHSFIYNHSDFVFPCSGYRNHISGKFTFEVINETTNVSEQVGRYYSDMQHAKVSAFHLCLRVPNIVFNPHYESSTTGDALSIRPIRE